MARLGQVGRLGYQTEGWREAEAGSSLSMKTVILAGGLGSRLGEEKLSPGY
jgi:hypothetical protein